MSRLQSALHIHSLSFHLAAPMANALIRVQAISSFVSASQGVCSPRPGGLLHQGVISAVLIMQSQSYGVCWHVIKAFSSSPPHHAQGLGMPLDLDSAVEWLQKAADAEHESAMRDLGMCLLSGKGMARDDARGVDLLLYAAEAGDVDAMEQLVRCYREGAWRHHGLTMAGKRHACMSLCTKRKSLIACNLIEDSLHPGIGCVQFDSQYSSPRHCLRAT